MNKRKIAILAGISLLALTLSGCGGGTDSSSAPAKKKELLFATGGTAGTYYPLGGAMAQVWNAHDNKVNVTVQSTGASVENVRLLNSGDADIALAMNNVADDAYKGVGSFKEGAQKKFLAIGSVYPEVLQGFVPSDSDIKDISGLKGKKVAVGPVGSGTEVTTKAILQVYGLDFNKNYTPIYATFADAVDQFKDGHLDAAWNVLAVPASAITDVSTTKAIRFLEITGPKLEELMAKFPLVAPYTIPANTYKGVTKDVQTVSLKSVLYARTDLDEDTVYNLTKVMYENNEEIAKQHNMGKEILLKNALQGVTTPLHPGAIKYYKEKGVKLPS